MNDPIRALIIDDSPSVCRVLTSYLADQDDIDVIESVNEGDRALERVYSLRPDVLLLDVDMPGLSGLQVLDRIMSECPTPVVLISGVNRNAATASLEAFKLGAVDFIFKYSHGGANHPASLRKEVISKVRSAAEVKVVRSLPSRASDLTTSEQDDPTRPIREVQSHRATTNSPDSVLVIGASTGGPVALRAFLAEFSPSIPAAVLVIQHFPAGFNRVLAAQLDRHSSLDVRVARHGDRLGSGQVLIAPSDFHMLLGSTSHIELSQSPEVHGHRPSISLSMKSAAEWFGNRALGVLLSGMGEDGLAGLQAIQVSGGKTYVQDLTTCVASGMPERAINGGFAGCVASPEGLAKRIAQEYSHSALERVM